MGGGEGGMRAMWSAGLLALGLAGPAAAHPHVFVDAGLAVIFDATGRAEAVRISWTYDDLFSLLIIEDKGLDPDYDGVLDAAGLAALQGFDMNWDAGYPGDTYALLGDAALELSRPAETTARYEGGKITSTHLRRFAAPVVLAGQDLVLQVYDPSFYTAYTIAGTPVLTGGTGCTVQVFEPDRAAADAKLLAAIDELAGASDTEAAFPAIGAAYAEEARITCAAR